ncbi:MAG: helix-turn-helix domain-containing protein [Actinobacteria bacterium]|nr:helix-turn-helix domain-containing protein [Actinomycetota bacterium]
MAPQPASRESSESIQARDVVAFGQEIGRVLSDGRIVGRAEPFAKVFASSRAVKRAVGVTAWAILEDIALDASLDAEGRLVAETNVRRIADNLGLSKNTVTKHLGKLREHGFVLHEEQRDDGSGRYETSRYVLDPSACLERFTHAPKGGEEGSAEPRPKNWDTGPDREPRPKKWDTVAVSQGTGHRDLGQKNKKVVVREDQQPQPAADSPLVDRLISVGVAADRAQSLVAEHPEQQVADALDAVEVCDVRSRAGWVVTAIRHGWDVSEAADKRRKQRAVRRLRAQEGALRRLAQEREDERRRRAAAWEAAVSAALDDAELTGALCDVTTPVGALGRRSAPMAVSQLVAWAVACHVADPAAPLAHLLPEALAASVEDTGRPAVSGASRDVPQRPNDRDLPDPPTPARHAAPLHERVARLLPAIDHDLPIPTTKEEHP